jgi:hypothetical protein
LYYKDWYAKVINHPLFNNFIQSRQNQTDALFLMNTTNSGRSSKNRLNCKNVGTEPRDPKSFGDLQEGQDYNFCVMINIQKILEKDIPEYAKMKKNKESVSDFNRYFVRLYSIPPSLEDRIQ